VLSPVAEVGPALQVARWCHQRAGKFAASARCTSRVFATVPPLCVRGGRDEDIGEPHDGVDSIQLILDSAGYATLRPALGSVVGLRGSLLPEHTGHHHAPVLLDVIKPVRVAP